jgi:hypothetical protein
MYQAATITDTDRHNTKAKIEQNTLSSWPSLAKSITAQFSKTAT